MYIYIYRNKICPTYRPDIGIAALYGGGERGGEKEVGLDGLRKKGEGEEGGKVGLDELRPTRYIYAFRPRVGGNQAYSRARGAALPA